MKKLVTACFARWWVLPFSASAATLEKLMHQAQKGDAAAQYTLGMMFDKGRGVEQNDVEAIKW